MSGLHPFERAGMGFAPFKFKALHKAGGACQLCGKIIAWVCVIEDVDGRESTVGTDCVSRVNVDARLRDAVEREAARQKSSDRKQRDLDRFAAARAKLDASPSLFADLPHPWKRGSTYRDDVTYRLSYMSSARDRSRAVREVESGHPIDPLSADARKWLASLPAA